MAMKKLKTKWYRHLGEALSRYPACDHLNCALRLLLDEPGTNKAAIQEICFAIFKSHGYFYEDIQKELEDKNLW